jgi:hypothetical protein
MLVPFDLGPTHLLSHFFRRNHGVWSISRKQEGSELCYILREWIPCNIVLMII